MEAMKFLVPARGDGPGREVLRGILLASCFGAGWGLSRMDAASGEYRAASPNCSKRRDLAEGREWVATVNGVGGLFEGYSSNWAPIAPLR